VRRSYCIAALTCVTAMVLAGCNSNSGSDVIIGSGKPTVDSRSLDSFIKIQANGALDLVATSGALEPVLVSADDNIAPTIITKVVGDTLVISSDEEYESKKPVTVTVQSPGLAEAVLAGAGDLSFESITAPTFRAILSGAGDITLEGTTKATTLKVSGAGDINAQALVSDTATAIITGAGDINVGPAESVDYKSSGAGEITYTGDPVIKRIGSDDNDNIRRR
jgi:PHD/YefM family antitoxin component YafN of YafNO toxin-antitoxin module